MHITSNIWTKESNSLFDYDSNELIKNSISVKSNGILHKNERKLFYESSNHPEFLKSNDSNFLANIRMLKDSAELNLTNSKEINKKTNLTIAEILSKPWLVARHTYSNNDYGFKLHEGDYLKLGKIIFKVKEIYILNPKINNKEKCTFVDPFKENVSENARGNNPNNLFSNTNYNQPVNVYTDINLRNVYTNEINREQNAHRRSNPEENKLIMKENKSPRKKMFVYLFIYLFILLKLKFKNLEKT